MRLKQKRAFGLDFFGREQVFVPAQTQVQKPVMGAVLAFALLGLMACQDDNALLPDAASVQEAQAGATNQQEHPLQTEDTSTAPDVVVAPDSSIEVAGLNEKWVLVGFAPFGVHRLIKSQAYLDLQDLPRARVHAGCQMVSAAVTVQSVDSLGIAIDEQAHDAQCQEDDLQAALLAALQKANGYGVSDMGLTVRTSDGQQLFFTKELGDAADLQKKWALVEFAPHSVHHLVKAQATMDLTQLPRVHAHMGCNSLGFDMTFAASGQAKAGDVTSTRMACDDMQLEQAFVQAIVQPSRYKLTSNGLYVVTGDDQVLRFTEDVPAVE